MDHNNMWMRSWAHKKYKEIQSAMWNAITRSTWNKSTERWTNARPQTTDRLTENGWRTDKNVVSVQKDIFLDILDQDQDKIKIRPRYTWRDQDQVQHASLHALSTNACRLLVENSVNWVFSFSKIKLIKISWLQPPPALHNTNIWYFSPVIL